MKFYEFVISFILGIAIGVGIHLLIDKYNDLLVSQSALNPNNFKLKCIDSNVYTSFDDGNNYRLLTDLDSNNKTFNCKETESGI